jgi:L-idonate 5-dehydrogenase
MSATTAAQTTRAVVIHKAHDLRVEDVPVAAPGPGEVLVRVERGGICGSDLHYYHDGGFGAIRVREPLVLGHEFAGVVATLGAGVTTVKAGDRVAVNPSRPCNACRFCLGGKQHHCLEMRFYGSAMRFPHVQGGFRDHLVTHESQCLIMPAAATAGEAAMCEPMAVCLHAVARAGTVTGRRVLVTGCGPIGVLSIMAARAAGAREIIATDVNATPFKLAQSVGAARCINVATDAAQLAEYATHKGAFDLMLECSGNERALVAALDVVRPQGVIVQVGIGGTMNVPMNVIVAKEIDLRGTFRFNEEFALAASLIGSRQLDVRPVISETMPMADAVKAFDLASDRSKSIKVQLAF